MSIKAMLETLDGLDATLKSLYVPTDDGKFRLDAEGVEDVSGLKSALTNERNAHKTAAQKAKDLETRYKDIDPDKARELMSRIANDEETRLISEGKIDEVIEKRTAKQREALEKAVKIAEEKAAAAEKRSQKFSQRVLDDQLRAAAAKVGVHTHAVDDVLFRGRAMFQLSEDGQAIQFDESGHPIPGKDGKTPFNPEEWLQGMKETAPHWFPAIGNGGGASGSGTGFRGQPDMSNLSPAERITRARANGQTRRT